MKKVLVIGASGLVGSRFIELAKEKLQITPVDEHVLDITDKDAVEKYFSENSFDAVVNFAAVTNVDAAEKERGNEEGFTWKLNVFGVKNLIEECQKKDVFLVQISTDFVFKGTEDDPGPYSEEKLIPDNIDGLGWYGWTKNRAERLLTDSSARHAIVRIAYPFYAVGFPAKADFVKNYLKLYDEEKLYPVFTDQVFTPLNVDELSDPLVKILAEEKEGIFHIVSSNSATTFEFVEYLLLKARNASNVVQKGSMQEFLSQEGRTPRPRLGGLKTEVTQEKLGLKFKTWQEMINEFIEKAS